MICSHCGADNPPNQKFCGECGTQLAAGCPNCGATNPPGQRFCGECGTALATEVASARPALDDHRPLSAPATQAERRLVTVLFADLVGFTPFAEERDAEEVRDTLTRYFELASDVVGRYGGTIPHSFGVSERRICCV